MLSQITIHGKFFTGFIFILSFQLCASAQDVENDTTLYPRTTAWKRVVLAPAILTTAGLLSTTHNEVFDKWEIEEARNYLAPGFRTHVDDFLPLLPIVAIYGMNISGMKGEHDLVNLTALIVKSELIMAAIVFPLKKFTAVPRPTGEPTSFPSGHTAQAFVAATIFHKEYGKDHPLLSVAAYATASSVGILRIMNNRHWASDVLVGAGVGILSTNLAYMTHQNKLGKTHKRLSGALVLPSYNQGAYGFSMVLPLGNH